MWVYVYYYMTPIGDYVAGVLKREPQSRIRTAKGFSVDRRGPPVIANKAEKRGPWTPEVSENCLMWTPAQKVWVPLLYGVYPRILSSTALMVFKTYIQSRLDLILVYLESAWNQHNHCWWLCHAKVSAHNFTFTFASIHGDSIFQKQNKTKQTNKTKQKQNRYWPIKNPAIIYWD